MRLGSTATAAAAEAEDIGGRAPRIAAIVLAAGLGKRMDGAKLTAPLDGAPLVRHVAEAAIASRAEPVIVVVGHEAGTIRRALSGLPVGFVDNPGYRSGIAGSLATGLAMVPDDADGAIVLLGDMPRVRAAHIDRLIAAFSPEAGSRICLPTYEGRRGNPVLWERGLFPRLRALSGDRGGRALFADCAGGICEVPMADDAILIDVDTAEALRALRPSAQVELQREED